jgi:hypothetical protein
MKNFIKSKKGIALLATLVVAAVTAVGAFAYFTSGGSGSGSASVGTSTSFVLYGSSASTLYPGTSSVVTFTADNPGSGHQYLAKIHLDSIDACDLAFVAGVCADGHAIASCGSIDNGSVDNAAKHDFYMGDVTVNHDYAPGNSQAVTPTGLLVMNDLSSSQNSCKNAYLKLNLSST